MVNTKEIFDKSIWGHQEELGFPKDQFNEVEMLLFADIVAEKQQKEDIEYRFGAINHIQNILKSIVNDAEHLTTGNIAHNRASIKLLAEGLLNYINEVKE